MSAAPVINLRFNRDGSATGDPGQSALRRAHLHDLERIDADVSSWRTGVEGWARNNVFVALAVFLFRAIRTLLWTLILAPATAFIDPLGTAAALTITPLIQTALVVVAITFAVGKWLGLDRVMDRISDNYADGYSAANWVSLGGGSNPTGTLMMAAKPPSCSPVRLCSVRRRSPRYSELAPSSKDEVCCDSGVCKAPNPLTSHPMRRLSPHHGAPGGRPAR